MRWLMMAIFIRSLLNRHTNFRMEYTPYPSCCQMDQPLHTSAPPFAAWINGYKNTSGRAETATSTPHLVSPTFLVVNQTGLLPPSLDTPPTPPCYDGKKPY